jgi:hypothetical protein
MSYRHQYHAGRDIVMSEPIPNIQARIEHLGIPQGRSLCISRQEMLHYIIVIL